LLCFFFSAASQAREHGINYYQTTQGAVRGDVAIGADGKATVKDYSQEQSASETFK
jgi:hypothetical protein